MVLKIRIRCSQFLNLFDFFLSLGPGLVDHTLKLPLSFFDAALLLLEGFMNICLLGLEPLNIDLKLFDLATELPAFFGLDLLAHFFDLLLVGKLQLHLLAAHLGEQYGAFLELSSQLVGFSGLAQQHILALFQFVI